MLLTPEAATYTSRGMCIALKLKLSNCSGVREWPDVCTIRCVPPLTQVIEQ